MGGNIRRRRTILIPLDGSSLSELALTCLHRVLQPSASDVVLLLRVIGPGHGGVLVRGDDAAAYSSAIDQRANAQRHLANLQSRLARRHIKSRVFIRTGDPVAEIVRCARVEHVDLILMSTHGRSGLRRALMGSVAERVLRRAPAPSLLVPARARRAR